MQPERLTLLVTIRKSLPCWNTVCVLYAHDGEKRNLVPVTKMKPKSTTSDVHPNGFSVLYHAIYTLCNAMQF